MNFLVYYRFCRSPEYIWRAWIDRGRSSGCFTVQGMAGKVLGDLGSVGSIVLVISTGNTDAESQIIKLLMEVDIDDRSGAQYPASDGLLGFVLGMRGQEMTVNKGAVCGCILDHDVAMLVDIYAEVNIAEAPHGVVGEDDIAPSMISAEGEASSGILDGR